MNKKRTTQHIMEDSSISIFRGLLPKEWVIHEYKPDYGIDFAVEIFNHRPCSAVPSIHVYETLGETFYVQLKSTNKLAVDKVSVKDRFNVEKKPLEWFPDSETEIQVVKHSLDTSFLQTVHSVGAAVPVLLVLVCIDQERAFFVCLNDYIDKILTKPFAACPAACRGEECMPLRGGYKGDREVPLIQLGPCSGV